MLSIKEIKLGKILHINNEPFVVIRAEHHKQARSGAVLKTKLKNLITGSVIERTWQGNDKADEAQIEKKAANYLYRDDSQVYLMDNKSYEQFSIELDTLGGKERFLKDGTDVDVMYFNNTPVSIALPIKVELKVTSAPPGVKGNTAGNVMKTVELETGATIQAPLFINAGDIIRVNTDSEEYSERV